MLNFQF